jgi:hypothetical protein
VLGTGTGAVRVDGVCSAGGLRCDRLPHHRGPASSSPASAVFRALDCDRRLRMPVLVDLPLQPGQRLLRLAAGRAGLADVLALVGQGSIPVKTTARKLPEGNGSMWPRGRRARGGTVEPYGSVIPRLIPRAGRVAGVVRDLAGQARCPQRDSNPCYRLERPTTLADGTVPGAPEELARTLQRLRWPSGTALRPTNRSTTPQPASIFDARTR